MRVLILGPDHPGGSLPPYLDALAAGLRRHGVTVGRHGSASLPYDQDQQRFWPASRVIDRARALVGRADLRAWDVLSVHFGNLEIEQLAPVLWAGRPHPPAACHVHTLEPTLFRDHLPDPHWQRAVLHGSCSFDGYVYFGEYARARQAALIPGDVPTGVAWLPTTIPAGTSPSARPALAAALDTPDGRPVISLYGYAAPWKDAALLHAAARRMRVPARIVLAGQFWDDPGQAGIDLTRATRPARHGAAEFVVVPGYLDPADRAALARDSTAAVFPYRPHPSFQGSGAIADYLACGVPVVATDVANMAELAGDTGRIVPAADPAALAAALDSEAASGAPGKPARHAGARAGRFTADAHAARCLEIYQQVLARATPGTAWTRPS
jgi:glycosyltransferase involved in cell wall biosynthesis